MKRIYVAAAAAFASAALTVAASPNSAHAACSLQHAQQGICGPGASGSLTQRDLDRYNNRNNDRSRSRTLQNLFDDEREARRERRAEQRRRERLGRRDRGFYDRYDPYDDPYYDRRRRFDDDRYIRRRSNRTVERVNPFGYLLD